MNKFLIKNKIKFSRGFTLVELMVATSIFISIMLMAMGSLVVSNDTSKRAEQLRVSMDNVNFAMETMTRSIRMGNTYSCGNDVIQLPIVATDCISGGNYLAFNPADNMKIDGKDVIVYQLKQDNSNNNSSLQRCSSDNTSSCVNITSPDVDIDTLKFFVNGSSGTDGKQPSVYIIMRGSVTIKGEKTSFALQTLASQRSTEIVNN